MGIKNTKWKYSPHYRDYAEGHFFIKAYEGETFTINIIGNMSMSQTELDNLAEFMLKSINKNLST